MNCKGCDRCSCKEQYKMDIEGLGECTLIFDEYDEDLPEMEELPSECKEFIDETNKFFEYIERLPKKDLVTILKWEFQNRLMLSDTVSMLEDCIEKLRKQTKLE